jgi:hypothetical protein
VRIKTIKDNLSQLAHLGVMLYAQKQSLRLIMVGKKQLGGSNLDIIMLGTLAILTAAMYGIICWSSHVVDEREEK